MKETAIICEACDQAGELFGNGFHCAEAVAWAVLQSLGQDPTLAAAHATPFGGGFGKTYGDACGALSGGLIAIGHIHGRKDPSGDWDLPASLGAGLRQHFVETWGTTHCATLRDEFGEEFQMERCREVVRAVTRDLLELLARNHGKELPG
ncbi:C-GCAxxG-C-C family protein [Desulfospira joergensenii]|uniref:C-GCAxxG-C-C family protein n=1 Tax=Desulfospira joergensenii TaxID=53329 RepID=UPI0003B6766A|nr:C-GCAxxG-C-C family protein [Desulfospira joergensenii]